MRVALVGYGHVGKAFARLLERQRLSYPFRIVGVHTATRGTAIDAKGLPLQPAFGPAAASLDDFWERARPEVAVEITTLNPETGEPAISHIRSAIARGIHVITANKGPIAHAYAALCAEARRAQVEFRFEATVMDGAPVFNTVRNNLPAVRILGFTGVLNSTTKVVMEAMQRGLSLEEGIREAQGRGIAEADAAFDIDGWDSAAKTAALANVLMDARLTPRDVQREGIRGVSTAQAVELAKTGRTIVLVSRAEHTGSTVRLQVKPETVSSADVLASVRGTSNLILFHTDLMGTVGTISIDPGVEQTAYGLFADLVDIARSV